MLEKLSHMFFCVTATITVVWGKIKNKFTLKGLCVLD